MSRDLKWRELYRSDDGDQASMIATCLEAMEFEVRVSSDGATVSDRHLPPRKAVYRVDVPTGNWDELREVLEEIISEQTRFDAFLSGWPPRANRWKRWLLGLTITTVVILSVLGVIDL